MNKKVKKIIVLGVFLTIYFINDPIKTVFLNKLSTNQLNATNNDYLIYQTALNLSHFIWLIPIAIALFLFKNEIFVFLKEKKEKLIKNEENEGDGE